MRAVLQRVSKASVTVDGRVTGEIENGLVILLGVRSGDTDADAIYLAEKCINMRIFSDSDGKFNLSALDVNGGILVVSQFTLYGDTRKGRRPNFTDAAPPDVSEPLYERFISYLKASGLKVAAGVFGAMMLVEIHNDGPVTIIIESK
ncbi:MAG: D-aminoacyl-tRNA deacylase [candidate division KSB1 bacterium]|jgi:D-tyrosyl-tRNA(Tyr) deacylase|nr:D-aminoacyl-tRNA deacylase [candidate division KSB1 bacterium]